MEKKNDLSNLISKKNDHNQRKRHNQHHHNINNNTASGNALSEANSNSTNDSSQQNHNSSSGVGSNFRNNGRSTSVSDTAKLTVKMPIALKIGLTALAVMVPLVFLMLFVVLFGNSNYSNGGIIGFGGYHSSRCNEMTVIFVDSSNGYEVTGSQTYSMEDYVAGVVYAEVGGARNLEVYKTFAIAARTFALRHASDDCAIEGSARRQAFKDITDRPNDAANMIYEAVQATEGQVLISNGDLYPIQYDAFCYIDKDSNYYTLSQKNQKIPTDWVESNISGFAYKNCPCNLNDASMTQCWSNGTWQDGGHGRGMSQYGSYYLAKELDYTYDEILEYYYGEDEVTISSSSFMISIAGLEIKDTTKAKELKEPITTFLSSKGSSLDDLNSFIDESVAENGAGTREGVITAAVSLINYLYDNFNTKLPYYWGGKIYSGTSIPSSFGTYAESSKSRGGGYSYYKSFDCSGFVSWAIRKGGYNFSNQSTVGFDSNYSQNSCNITDSTCIGQPGDLINSRSGHVELIIAVDTESGKYFVAESGGKGVTMTQRDMHKGNSSNTVTKIIFMEEFYSNPSNVNTEY